MQLPTFKLKPSTKKQIHKLKIGFAKFIAYVVLILAASYGFRSAFRDANLQESAQLFLTILFILSLVFVITLKDE